MDLSTLLFYLLLGIQNVYSQFVTFQTNRSPPAYDACKDRNQTHRVEHFFNLIFSEFHTNPPMCVCVQMCPGQPMYCYPTNCFKKSRVSSPPQIPSSAQVSQLQSDITKPMSFLVSPQDAQTDHIEHLPKLTLQSTPVEFAKINSHNDLAKNSFKERYKTTIKFRKIPQVQLRYNLREQIKHKKSDVIKIEKIDMTKAKWPVPVFEKMVYFTDNKNQLKPVIDEKHINFFPPRYDMGLNSNYQSRFFKRDVVKKLPKRENVGNPIEDDEETFSLNDLVENLIDNTFTSLPNNTDAEVTYSPIETITLPYTRSTLGENNTNGENDTTDGNTNIYSISNTSESKKANSYLSDDKDQMYKNVFNEMIASLSKNIEMNNNSSKEMMEHVFGLRVEDANPFDKTEIMKEISFAQTNKLTDTSESSKVARNSKVFTPDDNIYINRVDLPIENETAALTTAIITPIPPTESASTSLPNEHRTSTQPYELEMYSGFATLPNKLRNTTQPAEHRTTAQTNEETTTALLNKDSTITTAQTSGDSMTTLSTENTIMEPEEGTTELPTEYVNTVTQTDTSSDMTDFSGFVQENKTFSIEIVDQIIEPTTKDWIGRGSPSATKKSRQILRKKLIHSKRN